MREVVITDVNYRMSMTAIRTLGKRGIPITAVAYDDTPDYACIGFYSKYVKDKIKLPSPHRDEMTFVKALCALGESHVKAGNEKPVLIVPGSKSMQVLTKHLQELSLWFEHLLVDHETYNRANNTQTLLECAHLYGVKAPHTTWLEEGELIEALAQRVEYPVVVKYREGEKLPLKASERYAIVRDALMFMEVYPKMHAIQPRPLVQEYIEGDGFGVSFVFDSQSRPIEVFAHQRIREYPISGGPSTFCKSIWNDAMVNEAIALLEGLKWKGYAMVEFKGHLTGKNRLMEVNPRFWGSMALSECSGCDLAYAYYNALVDPSNVRIRSSHFEGQYRLDTKMRFRIQDLLAIKAYLFKGKKNFGFFMRAILSQLNPSIKDGLFRFSDPKPGIMYYLGKFL